MFVTDCSYTKIYMRRYVLLLLFVYNLNKIFTVFIIRDVRCDPLDHLSSALFYYYTIIYLCGLLLCGSR